MTETCLRSTRSNQQFVFHTHRTTFRVHLDLNFDPQSLLGILPPPSGAVHSAELNNVPGRSNEVAGLLQLGSGWSSEPVRGTASHSPHNTIRDDLDHVGLDQSEPFHHL
ncbi:hypothetical protein ILYODFUR_033599 [Ilyodon furcidens]|uniref:Uncharacterized protein n=1 Tax=Ilyodon furcidens TaxID=33524 RepID=A0ABV0V8A8_9TELE